MKKAESVKEFVERADQMKKKNPKDLSSDQDLTIGIMNLIAIEEHLIYTGAKTGKTSYYDLVKEIRQLRTALMKKVIPTYEGEIWCASKHLLTASMRLLEVGTKQLDMGNKKEAYEYFDNSYNLYCLFWGLNMNMVDARDLQWVGDDEQKAKEITRKMAKAGVAAQPVKVQAVEAPAEGGFMAKMKSIVRKAVDCCIE